MTRTRNSRKPKQETEEKEYKCKWYSVCKKSFKTSEIRNRHQMVCNNGQGVGCPIKEDPCNAVFHSHTNYSGHVHAQCNSCGELLFRADTFKKHKERHPAWGVKYSQQMHKVLNNDSDALNEARQLNRRFEDIFEKSNDPKGSTCYQLLAPIAVLPPFNGFVKDCLKYPGRSSYSNYNINLPARYERYEGGSITSEPVHQFFNLYANSNAKPIFLAPFDKESFDKATTRENLMIYTLGTNNLLNLKGGDILPCEFETWTKEEKALLGSFFVLQAYDFLKKTGLDSHLRITYCRLNDPSLNKPTIESEHIEKPEKKILTLDEVIEQLRNSGAINFEFSKSGSEFSIKAVESQDFDDGVPSTSGDAGKNKGDLSKLSKHYPARDMPAHKTLKYLQGAQIPEDKDMRLSLEEREDRSRELTMSTSSSLVTPKRSKMDKEPANVDVGDPFDSGDSSDEREDEAPSRSIWSDSDYE